jgi:homoserine O-acetyltransferase
VNKHTLVLQDSFTLESGAELKKPQVVYHTDGQLNEAKDNVILVVHALSANSEVRDWWDGLYGEGNVFDPERYFIICINNLGSPYGTVSAISENPTTGEPYGADFPFFTIRDTARLHMRVLHELGLDQIDTLIGPSCGGNIAQEMSIDLGEDVKNLILICCSSQETPWVIAVHEAGRQALKADPTFLSSQDGGREGLKAARALAIPTRCIRHF